MENHATPSAGMVSHASRKEKTSSQLHLRVHKRNASYKPTDLNTVTTPVDRCCEELDSIDTLCRVTGTLTELYAGGSQW